VIAWWLDLQLHMQSVLSPLTLWVRILLRRGVRDTRLWNIVCQWLPEDRWFSPGTPISSVESGIAIILWCEIKWYVLSGKTYQRYHVYRRFVKVTSLYIEINDAMFMAGLVIHNVKIKGEIYTSFISMTMFFS
jgi:hypothetical protein